VVALVSAALAAWSEHIPRADGGGGDGHFYLQVAKSFASRLREGIDPYRLQRVAPAATVHLGLRVLGVTAPADAAVVSGFQVLNCACLAGVAVLWGRIARVLGLTLPAFWLGIVGLLVNYAALKMASYYPVLNDVPAFFLGAADGARERAFGLPAPGIGADVLLGDPQTFFEQGVAYRSLHGVQMRDELLERVLVRDLATGPERELERSTVSLT
jgi:hypothetical protein